MEKIFYFILKYKYLRKKNETKTIWQRISTPEWPENFKIDNNVLHIRNLKESDAGMYECIIRHNGISQNMFVTLNVTSNKK